MGAKLNSEAEVVAGNIPFIRQPEGDRFFLKTWSGRIIILNTVIFALMAMDSHGLLMPTNEIILKYGAKDAVSIAQGEYFRFFTPMFVHIGFVHFAFNTWALYVFAYQLEHLFGKKFFLALYLTAGIIGNVASALFTLAVSAGASGALFGLLGAGYVVERKFRKKVELATGQKLRAGMYTVMVVGNLIMGLVIPQIDNAAHIGGLVSGIVFALSFLKIAKNPLEAPNKKVGAIILGTLLVLGLAGAVAAASPWLLETRINKAVESAETPQVKFVHITDGLRLNPGNNHLRLERVRLILLSGSRDMAFEDIAILKNDPVSVHKLNAMADEFAEVGYFDSAVWLREQLQSEMKHL
jgi:membrane associated rhomboid family serine protease